MRNENELQDIYADCLYDLVSIGMNPTISIIRLNKRLSRAYGRCFTVQNKIEINYDFYIYSDLLSLKNTIIHEILHAMCKPKVGHGKEWLDLCNIVNNSNLQYGKITQFSKGKEGYRELSPNYKYAVYCPNCGKEWYYKSMNKIVKYPQSYNHKQCGQHGLKLKENIDK